MYVCIYIYISLLPLRPLGATQLCVSHHGILIHVSFHLLLRGSKWLFVDSWILIICIGWLMHKNARRFWPFCCCFIWRGLPVCVWNATSRRGPKYHRPAGGLVVCPVLRFRNRKNRSFWSKTSNSSDMFQHRCLKFANEVLCNWKCTSASGFRPALASHFQREIRWRGSIHRFSETVMIAVFHHTMPRSNYFNLT